MKHVTAGLAALCLLVVSGCGGGGGTTAPSTGGSGIDVTTSTARVKVPVSWPALTRSISPSSFARSVQVTLQGANPDGSDFSFLINRGSNTAAFTQTYTSPTAARVGTWEMEVKCHSDANAGGTVVSEVVGGVKLDVQGQGIGEVEAGEEVVSLVVRPLELTLPVGASETFHAEVRGTENKAVTWSVQEGASGGMINGEGRYTAPNGTGTFHVIATLRADTTKKSVATVRVRTGTEPGQGDIRVAIAPASLTLGVGASETFRASVTGTDNRAVFWSVQEGDAGGTITDGGRYTAPQAPGEYHIVAKSRVNPDRKATAVVTVRRVEVPGGVITVRVRPERLFLTAGQSETFTATVEGTTNKTVSWSVEEDARGGTITEQGRYTAPATPGEYHVIARSRVNSEKLGRATVFVRRPETQIAVAVSPARIELNPGQSETFRAAVTGTDNTAVTWSVRENGGGTVTDGGRYTAPATPGEYHVVATSAADPTKIGAAVVIVRSVAEAVNVTIAPTQLELAPGGTETFRATVTGTTNTAVRWSIREGAAGGVITDGGRYTAPSTPGEYHIVATSQAFPTRSATAVVLVRRTEQEQITVTVRPSPLEIRPGQSETFTATVTGTTDRRVTWSVEEGGAGGTITDGGRYTAPQAPGEYHVIAKSVANPAKFARVTVLVRQ